MKVFSKVSTYMQYTLHSTLQNIEEEQCIEVMMAGHLGPVCPPRGVAGFLGHIWLPS